MRHRRSYDEACGVAHALDLVGERWALLVVRELVLGPKRFTDLRTGLPAISPNVLSQRLTELEESGVVQRRRLPPPAGVWVYELTEWGSQLESVLMALGRWGALSPLLCGEGRMSTDALILSLPAMFDPQAADRFEASIEMRIGEDRFRATVAAGQLEVARGAAADPDAIVSGEAGALASVIYGGRSLTAATRAGDVKVNGDRSVTRRFLSLFAQDR